MPDYITSIMIGLHERWQMTERETALIENILTYYDAWGGAIRMDALKNLLANIGLSDEEIGMIAKKKTPTLLEYPVDVAITRHYRTYVRVPYGADLTCVRSRAALQIVEDQDACLNPDEDLEIELEDITILAVNEEGVSEVENE